MNITILHVLADEIGDYCPTDDHCETVIDNSICTDERCTCTIGHTPSLTMDKCVKRMYIKLSLSLVCVILSLVVLIWIGTFYSVLIYRISF